MSQMSQWDNEPVLPSLNMFTLWFWLIGFINLRALFAAGTLAVAIENVIESVLKG